MSFRKNEADPWSLRTRLIRLFAAGGFAAWVFSSIAILILSKQEGVADSDIAMTRDAAIALGFAKTMLGNGATKPVLMDDAHTAVFSDLIVQVKTQDGHLLLKTADAPRELIRNAEAGFHDINLPGGQWRVLTAYDHETGLIAYVAVSKSRRHLAFAHFAIALAIPLVVGLPIVVLGAWILSTYTLLPIAQAARRLENRPRSDLSPIDQRGLPGEAVPLVQAFNQLLGKLAESWEEEKRFAASVAHELRTPLAGIRMNLQRLQKATDDPKSELLFKQLIGAVDRATRVIEQLFTIARMERSTDWGDLPAELDVATAINETLAEFAIRADARELNFSVECGIAHLLVPAEAFYLVLRNFVENAIRHAPKGSEIIVGVRSNGGDWLLEIEDAGKGLGPPENMKAPEEAFAREHLQLGLTLVGKIAELLGGHLESGTSPRLGGARFGFRAPIAAIGVDR